MANTKAFADLKKPVRQPTPEQIAAFEETGRADRRPDPAQLETETQKSVSELPTWDTEARQADDTAIRERMGTETSVAANAGSLEHGKPPLQKSVAAESRIAVTTEIRKPTNPETRISGPIVRLTIDLPEAGHTRFKTACAMTKRKMVDEVRGFIERRTAELEGQNSRVP